MIWGLLAFVVLLLLSAFFSAAETAFTALSPVQIQNLRDKHRKTGRLIEKMTLRMDIVITTLLIGNNLVNIGAASLVTSMTIELFGNDTVGYSTGILTLLILIFGEVTPKQIAIVHTEALVLFSARPIRFLSLVFRPIVWVMTGLSGLVMRLLGRKKTRGLSLEVLIQTISAMENLGVLGKQENLLVRNVLRISETPVKAFFTHRTDVFSLNAQMTIHEALPEILLLGFSRVPVYSGTRENIIGIVLSKEILRRVDQDQRELKLSQILSQPLFVPQSKKAKDMLVQFQKYNGKMAIVLDEYGGLAGLVTREDVLEEIMGELYDEDEDVGGEKIVVQKPGQWLVKGECPVYMVEEILGTELDHEQAQTISGFLTVQLGRFPQAEESVDFEWGSIAVRALHKHKILTMEITKNSSEPN